MIARWRVFMGFLAGVAYTVFAHVASWPRAGAGLGLAFLGLLLRGWAAGYLEKGKRLAQDGPYAYFRHPLYSGSFLLALGFAVAGTSSPRAGHGFIVWAVFAVLFCWIYPRRIREEEGSLENYFGDAWREYMKRTHRFLPRLVPARRENPDRFQWARYRKNHEHNAALGWLAGAALIAVKGWLGL